MDDMTTQVHSGCPWTQTYEYEAAKRLQTVGGTSKRCQKGVKKVSVPAIVEYDPVNRVTNMVDAAGTTEYAYTAGGQLWTEDLPAPRLRQASGPWSNDTVTNSYTYRMRTGLVVRQTNCATWSGASLRARRWESDTQVAARTE